MIKKIIFFSALIITTLFFNVNAKDVYQDLETNEIVISSQTDTGSICWEILKADALFDENTKVDNNNIKEIFSNISQQSANIGDYTLRFPCVYASGDYKIRVLDSTDEFWEKTITVLSMSFVENIMKEFNESSNSQNATEKIFDNIDSLKIDEQLKVSTQDEKNSIGLYMFSQKPYDNPNSFYQMLNQAFVVCKMKNSDNPINYFKNYHNVFETKDLINRSLFNSCDESEKNIILKSIDYSRARSSTNFSNELDNKTFLYGIENKISTLNLKTYVNANKSEFTSKINDYLNIADTYYIDKNIVGKKYSKISDLETQILSYILPSEDDSSNNVVSGGWSGGGNQKMTETTPLKKEFFNDIQDVSWAIEAITFLYEKGVVNGDGSGKFNPGKAVKREEVVKMIILAFDIKVEKSNSLYSDVDNEMWYAPYIATATKLGFINGIGENRFGVGSEITREDLCVILGRVTDYFDKNPNKNSYLEFVDKGQISSYAISYVQKLFNLGVVKGISSELFKPKEIATRAEIAKIIYSVLTQ